MQRLAWLAMAVFLAATALGVSGDGPLSRAQSSSIDGTFTVKYQRFLRLGKKEQIEINVRKADDNTLKVDLDNTVLSRLYIERIVPEPEHTVAAPNHVSLFFEATRDAPATIVFVVSSIDAGAVDFRLGVADDSIQFSQFVYP